MAHQYKTKAASRLPCCMWYYMMYEARGTLEMVMAVFESHRAGGPVSMPLQCKENPLASLS